MTISQESVKRANFIIDRADSMRRVKEIYSFRWPQYEKQWRMIEKGRSGEDEWRADLPETWSLATVKTAQSAFVDSKVVPSIIRHEDDPSSKALDLRDLYVDIAEKGNLDQVLYFTRLDVFKLGNGFTKTIYVKDKRKVWDIKKFNPKTDEFEWEEKEISDFDDPKTIRVSPYLVLKDDLAKADWNTVRDLIELEVMGRDEAEQKYGDLKDVPMSTSLLSQIVPKAPVKIADADGTGIRNTEFATLNKYAFFAPGFTWTNEVVEVVHYWNKIQDSYEILINGFPKQVRTRANKRPIPYIHKQIPYTHYMYSPYGGDEAWAAGIIEIGRSDANAIEKFREKMDDRQSISLFSPAFSDVNDEIDQRVLKLKPLTIIRTKGGAPKYAPIPGITTGDLALLDRHETSFKRATGIDERILGLQSDLKSITATEASFLWGAAIKRLREFLFLYKNALLHSEVKLKFSLFKQYFSNPLAKESKTKRDKGLRILKNKFKEFKVKINNVYVRKEVNPNFFEGETDVDLDLQLLMPMSQAQMVTMWSQILRDAVPFVQAGLIDISLKKVFEKYVEALGSNIGSLQENKKEVAIDMAEAEHNLYYDPNSSPNMKELLPNGTQPPFLTEEHILKHEELLDADVYMGETEKLRLLEHIKVDIGNLKALLIEKQQLQTLTPQAVSGVGGLTFPPPAQPPGLPQTPPPPSAPENLIS